MAFTTIAIIVYANFFVPRHQRAFVYLSAAITGTASIAYFSLASNLGAVPIRVEFLNGWVTNGGPNPTRSIWYARYIDWTITTPLLLLELLLISGMPLSNVFLTIFWDIVMIETGLIGALVESSYKWGFFTFGCVAMLLVFYDLYFVGWSSAKKLDQSLGRTYITGTAMLSVSISMALPHFREKFCRASPLTRRLSFVRLATLQFLWFLYPIAWGLADGGNQISPTGEMVFYGVLDLLAKPVFAIVHLVGLRSLNYDVLGLQSGKRSAYAEAAGISNGAYGTSTAHNTTKSSKALEAGHVPHHDNGVGAGNVSGGGLAPAPAVGSNSSEAHTAVHH